MNMNFKSISKKTLAIIGNYRLILFCLLLGIFFVSIVPYKDIFIPVVGGLQNQTQLSDFSVRFKELFNKVNDSVVRIDTLAYSLNPKITIDGKQLLDDPGKYIGSGFVYDRNGTIVTNYHVIRGASVIMVKFLNGNSFRAVVVGTDPLVDLAVLKLLPSSVRAENLKPLQLADPSQIEVGMPVVAIGSPRGLTGSMTEGIISQINRVERSMFFPHTWIGNLIQTDAPINHGNSGGPLLNLDGQVVGVNDRGVLNRETGLFLEPNIGLAISPDTVKKTVESILLNGQNSQPYMGIIASDIPPFFPERVRLTEAKGAYVLSVLPDSPASRVGMMDDDVIIKIDNKTVFDKADLINYVGRKSPGDNVKIDIIDVAGKIKPIDLTLSTLPDKYGGSANYTAYTPPF